jgi:hypothetical protein
MSTACAMLKCRRDAGSGGGMPEGQPHAVCSCQGSAAICLDPPCLAAHARAPPCQHTHRSGTPAVKQSTTSKCSCTMLPMPVLSPHHSAATHISTCAITALPWGDGRCSRGLCKHSTHFRTFQRIWVHYAHLVQSSTGLGSKHPACMDRWAKLTCKCDISYQWSRTESLL